jgi:hypothetical protein
VAVKSAGFFLNSDSCMGDNSPIGQKLSGCSRQCGPRSHHVGAYVGTGPFRSGTPRPGARTRRPGPCSKSGGNGGTGLGSCDVRPVETRAAGCHVTRESGGGLFRRPNAAARACAHLPCLTCGLQPPPLPGVGIGRVRKYLVLFDPFFLFNSQ